MARTSQVIYGETLLWGIVEARSRLQSVAGWKVSLGESLFRDRIVK